MRNLKEDMGKEIKRYSDVYSDERRNQGWWYFTTHGIQPGSVPKGVNILEVRDTPNGTYFRTDAIYNTSELRDYDIKERVPEDVMKELERKWAKEQHDRDFNYFPDWDESLKEDAEDEDDWYYGKEEADKYKDLILDNLSGKKISKNRFLAHDKGGIAYEAEKLGIGTFELLRALEGGCYQGWVKEIDDSTYQVTPSSWGSWDDKIVLYGESLNKKPANTKINIRESLNKYDLRTDNKYDLRNLYDACIMTDKEKRIIAEMISKNTRANILYEALMNKFEGKELKESTQKKSLKEEDERNDDLDKGIKDEQETINLYDKMSKKKVFNGVERDQIKEIRNDEKDHKRLLKKIKDGKLTRVEEAYDDAEYMKNRYPQGGDNPKEPGESNLEWVSRWVDRWYPESEYGKIDLKETPNGGIEIFFVNIPEGLWDDNYESAESEFIDLVREDFGVEPYIVRKTSRGGDEWKSYYIPMEKQIKGQMSFIDPWTGGVKGFDESLKEGVNDRLRQKAEPLANALDELTDRDDGFYITYSIGMDDNGAVTGGVDFELFKSSRTEEEAKAEIERVFDENGFELDRRFKTNPGKTLFGRTHYQIIEKGKSIGESLKESDGEHVGNKYTSDDFQIVRKTVSSGKRYKTGSYSYSVKMNGKELHEGPAKVTFSTQKQAKDFIDRIVNGQINLEDNKYRWY